MTSNENQRLNQLISRIWDLSPAERSEFAKLSEKRSECQKMPPLERKHLQLLKRQVRNKQRKELALHGRASG